MHTPARVVTRMAIGLVACLFAVGAGGVAFASEPIGPSQHFVGTVNGRAAGTTAEQIVYTVCPGPMTKGRTGPVLGGQTLSVAHVRSGGGFTGVFSQVNAWFVEDASIGGPQQVTLLTYGTSLAIPAAVRVPCDGTGDIEFSSCPHLAPCAFGWVPQLVPVRFVNVAY